MTDKSKKIDKNFDDKGHFAKGNTIGRMPKKGYTLNDLTNMAIQYDKTNDVSILRHYIEELKTDNRLLENFINRYIPQKQEIEVTMPKIVNQRAFVQAGEEPVIEEEPEPVEKKEDTNWRLRVL